LDMIRIGKIARCSALVRELLNRRLNDGKPGAEIVAWLNELPDVQAVVRQYFEGRPVNEQNLSDWRAGGFQDWQRAREKRFWAEQWMGGSQRLDAKAGENRSVVDYLAAPIAVELGQALERIAFSTTLTDDERLERLVTITKAAVQLRRAYPTRIKTREELELEKDEAELKIIQEELAQVRASKERAKRMIAAEEAKEAELAAKRAAREAKQREASADEGGRSTKSTKGHETAMEGAAGEMPPAEVGGDSDQGPAWVNQGESSLIKANQPCEFLSEGGNPVAGSAVSTRQQSCADKCAPKSEFGCEARKAREAREARIDVPGMVGVPPAGLGVSPERTFEPSSTPAPAADAGPETKGEGAADEKPVEQEAVADDGQGPTRLNQGESSLIKADQASEFSGETGNAVAWTPASTGLQTGADPCASGPELRGEAHEAPEPTAPEMPKVTARGRLSWGTRRLKAAGPVVLRASRRTEWRRERRAARCPEFVALLAAREKWRSRRGRPLRKRRSGRAASATVSPGEIRVNQA
jgi:hypothetical protein